MKKTFTLLLAIILVFSLAACAAGEKVKLPAESTDTSATAPVENTNLCSREETLHHE